jgi:glycerol uptake facilitator-like aquaporin
VSHIVVQIFGSLLGAILIVLIIPGALDGLEKTGVSSVAIGPLTVVGALTLEVVCSFFLTFLLLSVRNNENKKTSILLVFAIILVRIILFPTTGSTLNPARALAHAIIGDTWTSGWIFILAPIVGATAATGAFIWMHRQDME